VTPPTTAPAAVADCTSPDAANPVFADTSGNHLVDTTGRVMVPYGITVFGLASRDWQGQEAENDRQIVAAITQWCTNYVRIQVAPAHLLSVAPYDAPYLAAIEQEVQLAEHYDDNVILSAQTERFANQPSANPTEQTIQFWQVLAPVYRHDPRVWFDLFNEPRLRSHGQVWADWQHGVTVDGQQYVGMQQLVDAVRAAAGDANLILVEGPHAAKSLSGVPTYPISGVNLAYAVHPYGLTTESKWNSHFGTVAATVPVVVDEWAEWSENGGNCSLDAATYVPQFFAYLRQHQIGLGAWGLVPGVLVTNTAAFTPTQITSSYSCRVSPAQSKAVIENRALNGSQPVPQAQGVGQLLQDYFKTYARR
jgi:hypothetical protein